MTNASVRTRAHDQIAGSTTASMLDAPLSGTRGWRHASTGNDTVTSAQYSHSRCLASSGSSEAFTCCFAMDYLEGQDHTIDRPAEYDFWRDYQPKLDPSRRTSGNVRVLDFRR